MPPASPHNRKTGPSGEEEEEEDLVDKLIRNTGCEKEHYLVQVVELQPRLIATISYERPLSQECMVENQDWRKCQQALKTFQACLNSGKKKA